MSMRRKWLKFLRIHPKRDVFAGKLQKLTFNCNNGIGEQDLMWQIKKMKNLRKYPGE